MPPAAEIIAIAELCVYIPIFFLTLIIIFRHGFNRQLGWIYLVLFCIIRCVGAGFKIASEHNPTNVTDIEWAAILSSVGLSPLLLASLGLLKRVCDHVSSHIRSDNNQYNLPGLVGGIGRKVLKSRATANSRRSRVIQLLQIPTIVALALCIVGGTDAASNDPSDVSSGPKYTKVGVVMFLIIYLGLVLLAIITLKDVGRAMRGEWSIYIAVLAALPFLAVRLLYSIISAFSDNPNFRITGNKWVVQLFMAILEEFVIVCLYVFAGLVAGAPRQYRGEAGQTPDRTASA